MRARAVESRAKLSAALASEGRAPARVLEVRGELGPKSLAENPRSPKILARIALSPLLSLWSGEFRDGRSKVSGLLRNFYNFLPVFAFSG